ncbi:MAG: DUF2811 domain-containing protein [Cyanobacteria bacterium J06554_6]
MSQTVSLLVEIPEELHTSLRSYLDTNSTWNQDRLFCASLALFLMQNGMSNQQVSRLYLDSLFSHSA